MNKLWIPVGDTDILALGDRYEYVTVAWNQCKPQHTDAEIEKMLRVHDGWAGFKVAALEECGRPGRKIVVYRHIGAGQEWMTPAIEWLRAWARAHPQAFAERAIDELENARKP